ncbi:MAG: hypothetical protein ACFCUQ_04965 [Kiloniellales bacterium]
MAALPFGRRFVADYGDPDGEAAACRNDCALFDFSFVARARITGTHAAAVLSGFTKRSFDRLAPGRIAYALHARPDGSLVSDLTIWNLGDGSFEVMTGRPTDLAELAELARTDSFEDLTEDTAIYALQGPNALRALEGLADLERLSRLPYFGHGEAEVAGVSCRVGRLGYSGERGFELVLPRAQAEAVWAQLAERARPAGVAAADRLRIEAGLALFVNEFALPVTAEEAGLAQFASPAAAAPQMRLVCVRRAADERPLLWQPPKTLSPPQEPGCIAITSACWSPLANGVLALGYVLPADAQTGRRLSDSCGLFRDLEVVPLPFYDTEKRRPRGDWSADWRPL